MPDQCCIQYLLGSALHCIAAARQWAAWEGRNKRWLGDPLNRRGAMSIALMAA